MKNETLPPPDDNGIIQTLPHELSEVNLLRLKKFGAFMILYDLVQDYFVRPRLHKADSRRHRELLGALISPVRESPVLDIACGTGGAIPHFHSSNRYTGLDLSYPMLREAAKKANKKSFRQCTLIQGNAEELLFADASFGFVLMDTALHMIPGYQSAIAEAARVLTKGGVFVCSTPAVGINTEFDATWKKISEKRNLHSLTEEVIEEVCSHNDLTYSRYDTNGGVLYFQARKPG